MVLKEVQNKIFSFCSNILSKDPMYMYVEGNFPYVVIFLKWLSRKVSVKLFAKLRKYLLASLRERNYFFSNARILAAEGLKS